MELMKGWSFYLKAAAPIACCTPRAGGQARHTPN
jgi:hypothetical protein